MAIVDPQVPVDRETVTDIIDCDVHPYLNSLEELTPYMDESIQRLMNIGRFEKKMLKNMNAGAFDFPKSRYNNPNYVLRLDAVTPDSGVPGSDPEFLTQDLFDRFHTKFGILNVGHGSMSAYHNVDMAISYSSACNDWLYDTWVESDPRYKMTMVVPTLDPTATVTEIERVGQKSGIVGINLQNVNIPLGNRFFWPVYQIAEEYGLPIVLHPDAEGSGEYAPTQSVGPASTYTEWHTTLSLVAQRQIMSLVCEGVLEKFPKLKFVFVEYGFAWLPSVMWRLDKNWKGLRDEIPWVKMLPSDYIRRNIRLGTQPMEESFHPKDIVTLVQMAKAEDMLVFASDYPHWDGEYSPKVFAAFPDDMKRKIFYDNASQAYRL
ncbi:MAG: amidohydrolase family protein [Alicyclobacillaceae bacterium]|nr:amidohydrolase family protein [Alicyclobacillaceae bacterium]